MDITYIYLVENCYGNSNKVYVGKTKNSRKTNHRKTYGDQITYTIIDEINSLKHEDWEPLETYWIEQFRQWNFEVVNIRKKGGGGPEYYTEIQKQKMRKPKCLGHGGNVSKALKGRSVPWVTKALKGKQCPNRQKPICEYNINGELIKKWSSSKEAGLYYNIDIGTLVSCLKGRQKTCNKRKWKYST